MSEEIIKSDGCEIPTESYTNKFDGTLMHIEQGKPIGRLIIQGGIVMCEYTDRHDYGFPNAFRRFWYWALLGWKWERIK